MNVVISVLGTIFLASFRPYCFICCRGDQVQPVNVL